MKIGVLALQGAFLEHEQMLEKAGASSFEIRQKADLQDMDGLILPGGESTVMNKLLRELDIFDALNDSIKNGLPVFGTCAGLLLLAKAVNNRGSACFASMPITARRNAYGRQLGSFFTEERFGTIENIPMTFIRAPYIENADSSVEILSVVNDNIVAARYKNQLVTSFHPELNDDIRVHEYFLNMIK